MQPESRPEGRALLVQLARLGDLVQSLPAVEALREQFPERSVDVLCATALAPLLAGSHAIRHVIPWDGAQWRTWADQWSQDAAGTMRAIQTYLASLGESTYDEVYPLNQHARSSVLSQLFSCRPANDRQQEQLEERRRPWVQYLRQVAHNRMNNRVHLADAWCGMCGVRPRGLVPRLVPPAVELPEDLAKIGEHEGLWVAVVIGAGDAARCIPPAVWSRWIREFLTQVDGGQVVLIGSGHEREVGQAILETVPALLQGRIWDSIGRTTIPQLMSVLHRCRWVIGADTGPLHLGTLMGSRAVGFYFSRARVHETGPYGEEHWVYQQNTQQPPDQWPITESIALISEDRRRTLPAWNLWTSHLDQWGAYFDDGSQEIPAEFERAAVWQSLSPTLYRSVAA